MFPVAGVVAVTREFGAASEKRLAVNPVSLVGRFLGIGTLLRPRKRRFRFRFCFRGGRSGGCGDGGRDGHGCRCVARIVPFVSCRFERIGDRVLQAKRIFAREAIEDIVDGVLFRRLEHRPVQQHYVPYHVERSETRGSIVTA